MIKRGKRFLATAVSCLCLTGMLAGCGQEAVTALPEDVELLNPVGIAMNYETVARRNLYDTAVYSAMICPYVEEYELEKSISFQEYGAYPGETVKKGGVLLQGNTEALDKQIENMEKSIADMEENYQEFLKENAESLALARRDKEIYGGIMKNLDGSKPAEFTEEVNDAGEIIQVTNPAYTKWMEDYNTCSPYDRNASQKLMELEAALEQKTELYELDYAYNLKQLEYLKQDRRKLTLTAEIGGVVAAAQLVSVGDLINGGQSLMAVGDTERKELLCDYISKGVVAKAEDVYAIINGKRYEVEHHAIDADEYQRLEEANGRVYSTFTLSEEDGAEIEMGGYAVIVVINKARRDVLTVPQDAVKKGELGSYVYVLRDGESVYTDVETGMKDGMYIEILSGLEEGDKVLTESAITAGGETVVVERGTVKHTFEGTGYLFYPATEWIKNPITHGTAYYTERLVSRNQQVEKGEVLARIRVVPNELELERNRRKLQREQERLADLKAGNLETNAKKIEAKEEVIQDLQELIAEMEAEFSITEIKAPMDGVITDYADYEEEDLLQSDTRLFLIAESTSSYIALEDENGQLTYGNQASISYSGRDGQEKQAAGQVVTVNKMAVGQSLVNGYVLVQIEPQYLGDMAGSTEGRDGWWNRNRFKVTVPIRVMGNVLLVPRKAVTEENGRTYVKVRMENGEIQYRSFVSGGSDMSNYWVVEGLTEGMEICLE